MMREPGFYWVKFKGGKIEPVKFCRDGEYEWWEVICDMEGYETDDFQSVGSRIETPVL